MKKLLPVLLALVLALPSIAFAVGPSGTLVHVPDSGTDSGGSPTPKSWLNNDIFYVRLHTCRTTALVICGPDPLISSGAAFNGLTRIWVPFSDNYTIYTFVLDSEGNVVIFFTGVAFLSANSYQNFFAPIPPLPDGLYKLLGLAVSNGGKITFSNYYQFRVGGPNSTGCCP